MKKERINNSRKNHEFRQFDRRVWKEVELARRSGIHFEPYRATAKPAASGDESSSFVPNSANSRIRGN